MFDKNIINIKGDNNVIIIGDKKPNLLERLFSLLLKFVEN